MNHQARNELILEKVRELVEDLLVRDRKEDVLLPLGEIEESVGDYIRGVQIWEMTREFEAELLRRIPVPSRTAGV
jgi:hypothetical protein